MKCTIKNDGIHYLMRIIWMNFFNNEIRYDYKFLKIAMHYEWNILKMQYIVNNMNEFL